MPLNIGRLKRAGALSVGRTTTWRWSRGGRVHSAISVHAASAGRLTLLYRHKPNGRPAESITQDVWLDVTPCHLGGQRVWFCCPACMRRVAVIYGAGRLFACRRCKGLAYKSQKESDDDRAARSANRIRVRLGWPVGILNEPGDKPKGMHWRTYSGLKREHDALMQVALQGIARKLGLVDHLLGQARTNLDRSK